MKMGEIVALINLRYEDREKIIPLIDIPSDSKITEEKLVKHINQNVKKMEKNIEANFSFYLDNYEISDDVKINNKHNYEFILESFKYFNIIPVIGLDRSKLHNKIAIKYANKNIGKIAFRISNEFFDSFLVYKNDFKEIIDLISSNLHSTLLIDCRYIDDNNLDNYEKYIIGILEEIIDKDIFMNIVISGSSIPENIKNTVKVDTNVYLNRNEVDLYKKIKLFYPIDKIIFGDYTVISPDVFELNIDPKLYLNFMTSKIIYSQLNSHYFTRGKNIKQYGFEQYIEQAKDIIRQSFYRTKEFSWGDKYLFDKANYGGTNITPATIIGPTVNAHIAFMIDEISKGSL